MIAYEALAAAIVARQLQTDLAGAECIDWIERPKAAARRLAKLNYDQAPVTRDGALVGYVARRDLANSTASSIEPFVRLLGPDTFTSATASVLEVMKALLPDAPMTFVVDGYRVSGFVTPSDLNKHPARAHFYLLLADLEMALASQVHGAFPDQDQALVLLRPASQGVIKKRYKSDQRHKLETDYVAGMNLSHLLKIVGSTASLRLHFGADSVDQWETWTGGFRDLRDAVMHPSLEFLGPSRGLADLVQAEARIRALLQGSDAQ